MPEIENSIWQPYKDQGILVYAIHPGDPPGQVQAFIEQTGVTYPVIMDVNTSRIDFNFSQGVGYPYPRDIVIGKDLTIHSIKNSFDVEEMDALVQRLLAE